MPTDARYIIWDPKDGQPRMDDDGAVIISDGILGRLTEWNCYLTIYAEYPKDDPRRPIDLAVGECIRGVRWRLSGESGVYDIYRVS